MVKLMKVPKSIFRQTGNTEGIDKLMTDFFINAKDYVQSKLERSEDHYFEIKCAEFVYGLNEKDRRESDNRITYVEFKERYIIAGMLETRNGLNNLQFTFFRDLSCLEKTIADKLLSHRRR